MRTLRIDLRYDGTAFYGWQVQPDRRTVQGEVERALAILLDGPVRIHGAGRTDRGVHALHQVASFSTERTIPEDGFRRGLNGLLPRDIHVDRVRAAPAGFHARFSAAGRAYRYRLSDRPGPIRRRYAWCRARLPDLGRLQAAAVPLLGAHDFTAFSGSAEEAENPWCHVRRAEWRGTPRGFAFEIAADRFLNRMVRTIVGTALALEKADRLEPGVVAEILAARDRTQAPWVAPAAGLFLVGVTYSEP